MAESIECVPCASFGVFQCRETVDTCGLCGQWGDVFALMDYADENDWEGTPVEIVCLDCLCNGKHMKAAHADDQDLTTVAGRRAAHDRGELLCTLCVELGLEHNGDHLVPAGRA